MAFDVAGARKEGYSDTEIADHLARSSRFDVAAARKEGYDDADIIEHLNQQIAGKASTAPRKRTAVDEVTGFMANVNRGLGIGDELAAGARTATNALTGKVALRDVPADFNRSMAQQREIEDGYAAERPMAAAFAKGTGNALTAVVPVGGAGVVANGGRAINAARGATTAAATGAAYAAADRGTAGERLRSASETARNPVVLALGAGGGALAPVTKVAKPKPARQPTSGDILKDVGVSTTIPQRIGRAAKGVEDLVKRFPITGQAMAGYQDRQIGQLNRAVGLKALQPIGRGIPKEIKPGFEMVEYVDDQLGKVYDDAAKLVPSVTLDKELADEFGEIAKRAVDLPDSEAAQFERIINDRTSRLQNGASGEMVKKIHGELGGLQAEFARKGQSTLAAMVGDTRRAIMGVVARASPAAGKMIRRADEGWGIYSIMNDAAAAATARGGVFLPGQLNTQVRGAAKRMGSNMAGKGKGTLQELATAASETIPDSYGNPGTANAVALGSGGVGIMTAPAQTLTAGAALTAAATPYFLAGRKVIEALPEGATHRELIEAERRLAALAQRDPSVAELRRLVAARIAAASGVAAASAAAPRGAVEAYFPDHPERGVGVSSQ